MNELSFYGLDIINFLNNKIASSKSILTKNAPPDAVKGFDLGVTNTLLLLRSLIESMEPGEILINTQDTNMTEYSIEELEDAVTYGFIF